MPKKMELPFNRKSLTVGTTVKEFCPDAKIKGTTSISDCKHGETAR